MPELHQQAPRGLAEAGAKVAVNYVVGDERAQAVVDDIVRSGGEAIAVRADFDWPRPDKRREFLRARLNERGGLDLFNNQSSGVLTSLAWADGLIDLPPGRAVTAGDTVNFLPLAQLIG